MLVLAVAGILLGIAVPKLGHTLNQIRVEAATAQLVAAHQRARIMAITRGEVLRLSIDSARLSIARESVPLWTAAGPGSSGITLTGPTRQFTFSPEGFTLGLSNATLRVARGATARTIVISRLGRVRVLR